MPSRKLPNSNKGRYKAIKHAKELKDSVPPPAVIPFTPATIVRMDTFLPLYKAGREAVDSALETQLTIGPQIKAARRMAEYLISDFFSALQRAIRRGKFLASVRPLYGLAGNDANLPRIVTEADVTDWGEKASVGEAARTTAGGDPITFPEIAEVDLEAGNFQTLNGQQANAKLAYDVAQEALDSQNPEADKLILKMWNEIETAFDEGDKASMRRKAREWGVYYEPSTGETPSPEDFSIVGKVTQAGTGNALADVQLTVQETGDTVTTNTNGDYFIGLLPDGSYTMLVHRAGFADQTLPSIAVVAGTLVTLDIELSVATGTVSGTVRQAGIPQVGASVSVVGSPAIGAVTDMDGNYSLTGVPTGAQQVKATLAPPAPDLPQTQPVDVMADMDSVVDFNF